MAELSSTQIENTQIANQEIDIKDDDLPHLRGNTKTFQQAWLHVARETLIRDGIDGVKIDRLAKELKVTRGGFYWFFKSRNDILNQLLDHWSDIDNDAITCSLLEETEDPFKSIINYAITIVTEKKYRPKLETAMRDWARISKHVKETVRTVDLRRIHALTEAFERLYLPYEIAKVRAQIVYFHQVGYNTLDLQEGRVQRWKDMPLFFKQLTGFDLPDQYLKEIEESLS